jgi:hypothetical protein
LEAAAEEPRLFFPNHQFRLKFPKRLRSPPYEMVFFGPKAKQGSVLPELLFSPPLPEACNESVVRSGANDSTMPPLSAGVLSQSWTWCQAKARIEGFK